MKRLGRVLGNLLAVALTVFSMQTLAETQQGGRDFNHMTTGFPLSGGHATVACETCHMGGVFKGTAQDLRWLSPSGAAYRSYAEIEQPHRHRCTVRDLSLQYFYMAGGAL